MGQRVSLAADVYSLGVLLMELLTREPILRRGAWRLPHAPTECPPAVAQLLRRCTALDPAQRPTAAQVLACLQQAEPG